MDAVPRYPLYMAYNPQRTPDGRWLRAQWLVECNKYGKRHRDDDWTIDAAHYLRGLRRCRGGRPSRRLLAAFPHIHAARALRDEGGSVALEIQGRLLAGQTSDDISRLTGVAPGAIDAFEGLFFAVRAHLDAREWVFSNAVQKGPLGQDESVPAAVFKKFAFTGGPAVLEKVHPYLVGGKDPFCPLPDLSTPEARQEQRVRLAIACELLPHTGANAGITQKIRTLVLELEKKRPRDHAEASNSGSDYASLIEKAIAEAGFVQPDVEKPEPFVAPLEAAWRSA